MSLKGRGATSQLVQRTRHVIQRAAVLLRRSSLRLTDVSVLRTLRLVSLQDVLAVLIANLLSIEVVA